MLIDLQCKSLLDVAIEVPDPTRVVPCSCSWSCLFRATGIFGKLANETGNATFPAAKAGEPFRRLKPCRTAIILYY